MPKDLKILLIEDEPAECKAISQFTDKTQGVRLVGVTNSIDKALEYVGECLPDVVILDIELHKGKGNGIVFMEKLSDLEIKIRPYILVTTNNSSQVTYDRARELGADFIMAKHQGDYSAENVIEFLLSMKSAILYRKSQKGVPDELLTLEDREEITKRITKRINSEFELIGISPKVVGRKYLIDGIQIAMINPEPNICGIIAKKYGKSTPSVERAMQNAVNGAWKTSEIAELKKNYTAKIRSGRGAPTVTEFIYYYADKVKSDL